jgi:hypothetical protein
MTDAPPVFVLCSDLPVAGDRANADAKPHVSPVAGDRANADAKSGVSPVACDRHLYGRFYRGL